MINYERKQKEDQELVDGYQPSIDILQAAVKRDPDYAKKVRDLLGDPWDGVTIKASTGFDGKTSQDQGRNENT